MTLFQIFTFRYLNAGIRPTVNSRLVLLPLTEHSLRQNNGSLKGHYKGLHYSSQLQLGHN